MITSEKVKYLLSDEEYKGILSALDQGLKSAFIQNEVVPLTIPPTITRLTRWLAQEKQRLYLRGMTVCKKCYSMKSIRDRCPCSDGSRTENIFGLPIPDETKNLLKQSNE